MITLAAAKKELREISRLFYSRGWSLATSGNYSVRLDVRRMLITTTGMDKGKLRESDTVVVDLTKNDVPVAASAKAMLHR